MAKPAAGKVPPAADADKDLKKNPNPAAASPNQTGEKVEKDVPKDKEGCAVSFILEERDEMDPLCERTDAEKRDEYTQPENEKEDGGEG